MIPSFINSLRPRQWTKNFIVFGALFFVPGALLFPELVLRAILGFILFCFAAGAGYLFNDVRDRDYDRLHPRKCKRPIACGSLPVPVALIGAFVLIAIVVAGGFWLDLHTPVLPEAATPLRSDGLIVYQYPFMSTVVGYLAVTLIYSLWMRNLAILDVLFLSVGFVLRAVAGAVALKVEISPWLLLCTGLLALYLALGKRRQELVRINSNGDSSPANHRGALSGYTIPLLDQFLIIAASVNVMSYSLYTFRAVGHPDNRLMLTIPFVIYGLFRYHTLIYNEDAGEAPDEVLLKDKPLMLSILLWALCVTFLMLSSGQQG